MNFYLKLDLNLNLQMNHRSDGYSLLNLQEAMLSFLNIITNYSKQAQACRITTNR